MMEWAPGLLDPEATRGKKELDIYRPYHDTAANGTGQAMVEIDSSLLGC